VPISVLKVGSVGNSDALSFKGFPYTCYVEIPEKWKHSVTGLDTQ
jgi:hypothetical protein